MALAEEERHRERDEAEELLGARQVGGCQAEVQRCWWACLILECPRLYTRHCITDESRIRARMEMATDCSLQGGGTSLVGGCDWPGSGMHAPWQGSDCRGGGAGHGS
jgi:hypothetical protein